jgi:ABC-type transport system involved in multi-copper enzyme maturation permease subunit
MTVSAPRYTIERLVREPRWKRVRVIVAEGLVLRLQALNVVLIAIGAIFVGIEAVEFTSPAYLLVTNPGRAVGLASFASPYSSSAYLLLATLLAASAGASAIAGDVADRSITLYLSRPITPGDYLFGKGAAVGLVLAIFFFVPGVAGCLFAYLVGNVSFGLAALAIRTFLATGALMVVLFTTLALLLSSLTRRTIFAGAAIFGVLVSAEILADLLQGITSSARPLYASPIEDLLAVARSAFGVGTSIDPSIALAIVIGIAVVSSVVAYLRVRRVEVVA